MKATTLLLFSVLAVAASATSPYVQFLEGILTTIEPSVGGNVTACLKDSDQGFSDTQKGILLIGAGLQSQNITKIFAGAMYLKTALVDIRAAANACNVPVVVADMERLLKDLATSPFSILEKLLPDWYDVATDLSAAVNAFRAQQWEVAGEDIGKVLALLLTNAAPVKVSPVVTKPAVKQGATPYVDFLNGLLSQLAPSVNGSVAPCIQDSDMGLIDVTRAFSLLEAGLQSGNYSAIFQAVFYFRTALSDLQQAASDCNEPALATELAQLVQLITTNPLGVIDRLLPNIGEILSDIRGAASAFRAQQYNTAGVDIGKVLVYLLTPA